MAKGISANKPKSRFDGLLNDVAALGRVDILKNGRLVAVVLSPRALEEVVGAKDASKQGQRSWGENHMIPPSSARAARMLSVPSCFDED